MQFTVTVKSNTTIEAENEQEAREELESIIENRHVANGADQIVLDDIVAGASVDKVISQ